MAEEGKKRRRLSAEFKFAAVRRMEEGANVSELARDLQVRRKLLYEWKEAIGLYGDQAFPGEGARRDLAALPKPAPDAPARQALKQAELRIAELEREVGRQQMAISFFQEALRRVPEPASRKGGSGKSTSTRSSQS